MTKKNLTPYQVDDKSKHIGQFTFTQPNELSMILIGTLQVGAMTIHLRKKPMEQFQLISHGFHWVNESPYNR